MTKKLNKASNLKEGSSSDPKYVLKKLLQDVDSHVRFGPQIESNLIYNHSKLITSSTSIDLQKHYSMISYFKCCLSKGSAMKRDTTGGQDQCSHCTYWV